MLRVFNNRNYDGWIKNTYKQDVDSLKNGLLLWYKFDEERGTITKDSSFNGNQGDLIDTAIFDGGIIGDSSVFLDGISSYVTTNNTFDLPETQSFSLCFWMNVSGFEDSFSRLFGKTVARANSYTFFHVFNPDGEAGNKEVRFEINGNNTLRETVSSTTLIDSGDGWHHIVTTYNSINKDIQLFVNSELEDSSQYSDTGNFDDGRIVEIGRDARTINSYFNGFIDDARIYNRVLSSGEIQRLYQMGV